MKLGRPKSWKRTDTGKKDWNLIVSVISALLTVLGIGIAVWLQERKSLEILYDEPVQLVSINSEAESDIKVYYRDVPARNAVVLQVHVRNTGNRPILETDFREPLSFSFGPNNEIMDVNIVLSEPAQLNVAISLKENTAVIAPILLNPEDRFSIRFVIVQHAVTPIADAFRAEGRIAGVQDIKAVASTERQAPFVWILLVGALAGIALVFVASIIVRPIIRRAVGKWEDEVINRHYMERAAENEEDY